MMQAWLGAFSTAFIIGYLEHQVCMSLIILHIGSMLLWLCMRGGCQNVRSLEVSSSVNCLLC